ncbi:MAG: aldose epimerase family protein [Pseudodesulfovibrio sp.]
MDLTYLEWGKTPDGDPVGLFTLSRDGGLRAQVTDYGATLVSLRVPDRGGVPGEVVLGYDSPAGYMAGQACLGATIGRVANRVARARFELDGCTWELAPNWRGHQLHGGPHGFHRRMWAATPVADDEGPALALTLFSGHGDQGYPGNLRVTVTYVLTGTGLRIGYRAESRDLPTPVSLTAHPYFDLAGAGRGDVLGHTARFAASRYLVADADLIPTGEIAPVVGTPLDFSRTTAVGARIGDPSPVLAAAGGYDHYFVLDGRHGALREAAEVHDPASGRTLTVLTTQPGFQFYTANSLDETGRDGVRYGRHAGFCVEPSGYVDAVNHPGFPSVVIDASAAYQQTTEYRFTAQ